MAIKEIRKGKHQKSIYKNLTGKVQKRREQEIPSVKIRMGKSAKELEIKKLNNDKLSEEKRHLKHPKVYLIQWKA